MIPSIRLRPRFRPLELDQRSGMFVMDGYLEKYKYKLPVQAHRKLLHKAGYPTQNTVIADAFAFRV